MYYDLISTAGTRQKAFQKIEDFLQLITTLGNQGDENIQLFSADDVDAIADEEYLEADNKKIEIERIKKYF